jgi:disulfide bond formation protein DsbB
MFAALALISVFALGMALMSQYVFGLLPCNLCVIQRLPYGIVIVLGILGFFIAGKCKKTTAAIMSLTGLTFLANSVIAFYHSGVELKWWVSFLEGCSVPKLSSDIKEMMAQIQAAKDVVRCDEIPWADPILNLSMANYNVVFCFGLGAVALISARLVWKK